MVSPRFSGNRFGEKLSDLSRRQALQELGFRGLQFNLVVATNEKAVAVWERAGFQKIGRLPGVFRKAVAGDVGSPLLPAAPADVTSDVAVGTSGSDRISTKSSCNHHVGEKEEEFVDAWIMFCDLVAWGRQRGLTLGRVGRM